MSEAAASELSSSDLINRLRGLTPDKLKQKASKAQGFTKADLEAAAEADDYKLSKTRKDIKKFIAWAVAGIAVVFMLFILVCAIWLTYVYLQDVAKDPQKIRDLLKEGIFAVLVVLATLTVEKLFDNKG